MTTKPRNRPATRMTTKPRNRPATPPAPPVVQAATEDASQPDPTQATPPAAPTEAPPAATPLTSPDPASPDSPPTTPEYASVEQVQEHLEHAAPTVPLDAVGQHAVVGTAPVGGQPAIDPTGLSVEQAKERELLAAQGKVLPTALEPVRLVEASTYNGGQSHANLVELPANVLPAPTDDELDPTTDLEFDLVVTGVFGGEPQLTLVVKTSAIGSESSLQQITEPIVVSSEGTVRVSVQGAHRFLRAEFYIGGVAPSVSFSLSQAPSA